MPRADDQPEAEPGLLTHDSGHDRDPRDEDDPGSAPEPEGDNEDAAHAQEGGKRRKRALTPKQRRRRRWRIVRRTLYALFGLFVVLPALAFTIAYFIVDVPSPESVAAKQGQVITYKYSDGSLMGKVAPAKAGNRVLLEPHQIPDLIKHAAYAAEDASFETNPGFDITGILRAAWSQVTGGGGGGSTISQQYIKQATGYDDHTYVRKFVEVVKSFKMNNEQSKDEIITGYLNTVYLGRGAYGIQAAAQAYFDTDIGDLTPSQAALLAGMIQQPSRYDDMKYMKSRWNYVMNQMVQNHWLSAAKRKKAEFPDMIPLEEAGLKGIGGSKAFIKRRVDAELAANGYSEKKLQSGGYTIVTTIDPRAQKLAKQAVTSVMEGQPEDLAEALVVVDPQTGGIMAYYGGPNVKGDRVDGASIARNPGSSFKPFDLVGLLHNGQGLAKTYDGSTPRMIAGHRIHNAGPHSSCGKNCTVAEAMKVSANTVFVDMVVNDVGPAAVAKAAHQAGIPKKYHGQQTMGNGYNIAIGGGNTRVTPTMMASAYATFAANGVRHEGHFVKKLVDSDGNVVYQPDTSGESAFAKHNPSLSKKIAGNVTKSLEPVLPYSGLSCPSGYDCAGKTGTDEATGKISSTNQAWMVGYTPTVSAAAWVGTLQNGTVPITDAAGRPIYGADLPGSIWEKFMQSYLPGTPKRQFPEVELIGKPLPSQQPDTTDPVDDQAARQEDVSRHHEERTPTDSEDENHGPPSSGDDQSDQSQDQNGDQDQGNNDNSNDDPGSPGENPGPENPDPGGGTGNPENPRDPGGNLFQPQDDPQQQQQSG